MDIMKHIDEFTFKAACIGFIVFLAGCFVIFMAFSKRTKNKNE